jgi:hypothetical protein
MLVMPQREAGWTDPHAPPAAMGSTPSRRPVTCEPFRIGRHNRTNARAILKNYQPSVLGPLSRGQDTHGAHRDNVAVRLLLLQLVGPRPEHRDGTRAGGFSPSRGTPDHAR